MPYTHAILTTTGRYVYRADLEHCRAYFNRHCGFSFGWRIVPCEFPEY